MTTSTEAAVDAGLRDPEERRPLRNAVALIVGILVFWQAAYWIVGDVALRKRWRYVSGSSSPSM